MSLPLHFPQDQQSKREKQEMFKRSLDDQRRLKQRPSAQQHQLPDDAGLQGHHVFVPGLAAAAATLPDAAVNVPRLNHIPGLDQQVGYAPRFEGSPSPPQEKQPYMSAVSVLALSLSLCSIRSAWESLLCTLHGHTHNAGS